MKTAPLLFTLLFVSLIALSSTANLKKKKLTAHAKQTGPSISTPPILLWNGVTVNSAFPSISLPASDVNFGSGSFTLAFWFQTSGSSSLTDVIGNRQQGSLGQYLAVRLTSSGTVTTELCQDGGGTGYVALQSTNSGLNDGIGHHYALVRSGTQVTLYIDGVVNSQASSSANVNGPYPFNIGKSYSGFPPLTISFSDLRIYSSALTSTQVKAIQGDVAFANW